MGAKAWFVAYFDDDPKAALGNNPELDRKASAQFAKQLFPKFEITETGDSELAYLNPRDGHLLVGCYAGLRIVAHEDLAGDYPSQVDPRLLDPKLGRNIYVHATHSVVDWLAFGLWRDGALIRSLSVSPDNGAQESNGDPLLFEKPYWEGQFPVEVDEGDEPYPLPFHPLELSEVSMLHHLGFQFEGNLNDWVCDPLGIPISSFAIEEQKEPKSWRSKWKWW